MEAYWAQRDARDALREQGQYMQMEDDDFAEAVPRVTFKQWLISSRKETEHG